MRSIIVREIICLLEIYCNMQKQRNNDKSRFKINQTIVITPDSILDKSAQFQVFLAFNLRELIF